MLRRYSIEFSVLEYNRMNYDRVVEYIRLKELNAQDCKNDPLFSQIPILSAKGIWNDISRLPTGNKQRHDKLYEDKTIRLLSSLLYPGLDFAAEQSRTDFRGFNS